MLLIFHWRKITNVTNHSIHMILRTKNERYRKNIKAQGKYHLERIKDECHEMFRAPLSMKNRNIPAIAVNADEPVASKSSSARWHTPLTSTVPGPHPPPACWSGVVDATGVADSADVDAADAELTSTLNISSSHSFGSVS